MNGARAKICASLVSLAVGTGVLFSHETGAFFPWLPTMAFIGLSATAAILIFSDEEVHHYTVWLLIVISGCSILYRYFLFASPASLTGIDPNLYATWVRAVLSEGTIDAFRNPFYSQAPASVLLPATLGVIANVNSAFSLVVYPIVAGLLAPVLGAIFYRRLAPAPSNAGMYLTAILATIAATSIRYSYIPIAQMLSGLLLGCLVAILLARAQSGRPLQRYTVLVATVLAGLSITHKLGLFLTVGALALSLGISAAYRFGDSLRDTSFFRPALMVRLVGGCVIGVWIAVVGILASPVFALVGACVGGVLLYALLGYRGTPNDHSSSQTVRSYLTLTVVVLVVQWAFLTTFAERFVTYTVGGLLTFPQSGGSVPNYQAAVRASSGILNINGSWANVLLPILLVSLVVMAMVLRSEGEEGTVIGVGFIGVPLALAPTSIIAASSVGINAARLFIGLNPLLFAFIVIGFVRRDEERSWKAVLAVVFVVLIANQAFAVQSAPDYPGHGRQYLEASEVEAMEFAATYTDAPIYTDRFATYHRIGLYHPPNKAWKYAPSQFKPITTGYANRSLLNDARGYILQRGIDVYLLDSTGYWNLTWDPTATLERRRAKIYAASDTGLFHNASS
jgi:hypothetical protein